MPQKIRHSPLTREQLADRLYALGQMELQMQGIEARMNERIDKIRHQYAPDLERLREEHERLMLRLRTECEDSRDELLVGSSKSVELLFGNIQFRKQPDRVTTAPGVKEAEAADALYRAGRGAYVRLLPRLDKRAILEVADEGELEALARYGVRVQRGGEDVLVTINHDSVIARMQKGDSS